MRNLNEDSFPRLEKLDRMGYVQFLSDWSDAGSDRAAGRLNNYLATIHMESCLEITKIDDSDGGGVDPTTLRRNTEEVLLQENTFSLEDVSPVVKCLSGCLMPEGPGLGPCSPMVHDAFLHVLLDKGEDISSSGHLQPEGSGVNVGSLLGTVQASEFCGAFVLLMFHRCSVVRDWAWATILNLSTDGEGLLTRGEDEKCTIRLSLFTLKLLCALRHIFRVPLIIDNGDVRTILLGGFCRIVSIVTSLGLSLETIKRLLREKYAERPNQQDSSAVSCSGEAKPLEFPGDISKRVIETLGGGALIHWLLTNAHTRSSESIPPVTTESLATEISALLEAEEKKHSGKLKGKTQRCLAEIILAAILVNAKGAGEFEGSSRGVWHRQRLQELWQFASRIVAPPSGSSAVADNASPVRTDSWILRTLIGKLLELLGIETVVRSAKYFRGDSTSPEFRTMEVAVYVINSVLTSLSDTLPENAVSMHYYELLKSLQEDVRHLLIAVARHTSDIRQVLGLLKHFLLADIVRHGTGDGMHPEGSLRAVWDSYITMIGQATENIKRDSEGQTPAPAVQKLLLLFEVLSVFIDYPNVYNALLKCPQSKTDEPGDLASTLRRCVGRLLAQVSRLSKSVGRPQPSTQVDAVGGTTDSRRSSNGTLGAAIPADSISDSRVPLLMNVFILSTDHSLRFIGRRIMDLFCGTLDPTMQSALRSNAATWLTREVLLKEDIADNNMLTLDDTKVGDAVRAEGATWANVMAACDWPAVPGGVPLEAWWLCAQVLNLSTLERDVSSRLLSNVVHKLPPITSPDERTTRGGKKCLPLQSSATAHPAGGNHVVYIDSSTSSNSSTSDAEMDQDNRISEGIGSEGASSCRLSLPMLHQCAQRLFLALLRNNAVSPPTSFAKAILHVATQLKGLPLPETFTKKVRVALFGMYRRFWKESYAVLLDLSPPWLTAILHEVGREFNNRMIERRARERQAGVEEKYQQLMEVERNELDRRDASVLRANIDIRERELRRQRRLTTTANHDEVEIGIKRRRENSPALMIAQELPATTYSPVAAPQARQYDGQRGLPVARSVSAVNRCGSDIRSAPPHVRSTNERMLNEFKRIESATSCHEAIRRVAGCTDLGHCAPLIDDIIGLEPTCLAPEVPIIPVRFPSDKRNGFAKYISSFFPHIVLGMRYELYNCFDEVLKAAQSRWNPGTTRPVLDTIYDGGAGHVDSACGGRDNNGSSDPCDTHTGGGATRTNEIVQSVKWVNEKATTALCPGNVTVRGMDVPQVLFNVMLLPGNGDGRYHPKMNSFFSKGDAALLLFPLDVKKEKLPRCLLKVGPVPSKLGNAPAVCPRFAL
uniref:Uncharacterized protein TCIL3000_11_13750 n=1 Tax=Trypanosoma congolense (strain IL3000) TaxID=1068625 RepID=G0V2J7_TRYCI|nr:unnamed protein product [Trypanosoma congolense IL3000]